MYVQIVDELSHAAAKSISTFACKQPEVKWRKLPTLRCHCHVLWHKTLFEISFSSRWFTTAATVDGKNNANNQDEYSNEDSKHSDTTTEKTVNRNVLLQTTLFEIVM